MPELTVLQKAQKILATKGDISTALAAKNQTTTNVFDTYDDNILAIPTISAEGSVITNGNNYAIAKTDVDTVTDNTENTSLDVIAEDVGDVLLSDGAGVKVEVPYNGVISAAGITANKIMSGESILGVDGTATNTTGSEVAITASDVAVGKTAFVNGTKVTGTLAEGNINETGASVTTATGIKIAATMGSDKIVRENGTVEVSALNSDVASTIGLTANKLIEGNTILGVEGSAVRSNEEANKTVTPTTAQQIITPTEGNGYTGLAQVTVNAVTAAIDANITAGNIKTGVSVLGVSGTFTADGTATAGDIDTGKIAYVNGLKIVGTSTAAADKAALEDTIESLRQELADITDADDAMAEMQTIINNLETEIQGLKTDKATLQGQVTTLTAEKAALQTQLDDVEAVLDQINGEEEE